MPNSASVVPKQEAGNVRSCSVHYALFETAIGDCGIAWNECGVTRMQLPEASRAVAEKRLATQTGGVRVAEPPLAIEQVIADIRRFMRGERVDLSAVEVDMSEIDAFRRNVYAATRAIDWGETATYGEIARRLGTPDAREIGQALSRNPIPIVVPCHRVLGSDGKLVGFSAYGGTLTKERLLALEGYGADAPRLPGL